jgi:hypothetical protein
MILRFVKNKIKNTAERETEVERWSFVRILRYLLGEKSSGSSFLVKCSGGDTRKLSGGGGCGGSSRQA